jgi:hypothetical protein
MSRYLSDKDACNGIHDIRNALLCAVVKNRKNARPRDEKEIARGLSGEPGRFLGGRYLVFIGTCGG